ncbi:MAG: type II toxin-antitoxin system RelE/ParE family toxin, partial [Thermomicrobia bacterium]|nr:type II toxin-antitoxin system RelE/ParE family toxin [Thermomicrobia bacterium]
VKAAIDMLSGGPRYGDVRKLQGEKDVWRLRVGDWRVRLLINGATRTIVISRILPRGRAYRD